MAKVLALQQPGGCNYSDWLPSIVRIIEITRSSNARGLIENRALIIGASFEATLVWTSQHADIRLKKGSLARVEWPEHLVDKDVARGISYRPWTRYGRTPFLKAVYCRIEGVTTVYFNDEIKLDVETWLGILSLVTLVLALGAPKRLKVPSSISDLVGQLAALHWWRSLKIGTLPEPFDLSPELLQVGRLPLEEIVGRLEDNAVTSALGGDWTLTGSTAIPLMHPAAVDRSRYASTYAQPPDHEQVFAQAMVDNAKRALQMQHEANQSARPGGDANSPAARARRWLITHYPLLGSLLTQFELVEDLAVCHRLDISIAAIHVGLGEIYLNPARNLSLENAKFVIAHEVLHAGLCHSSRRQGRDPYLWNVACDFVINEWLISMGFGVPPEGGLLFDEALRGWAAENIYLRLAGDLRLRRRLSTLRGGDVDLLDDAAERFFTDREEFCRRALLQGLDYHQAAGRGRLPEGLVEAIRTLNQPPIPWQAKLADWIRERFPLPDQRRTYARPSRRQAATPEIPRPRVYQPDDEQISRTFGVVIDTSGSMEREDLGKALGAVVSYSRAQAVKQVRLIYCDAMPYDEGYVAIESLATRVSVRGRGGTVLQPAVTLLETRSDFPKDCPILIITDGLCERDLVVGRDHAFLLSPGRRLPFPTVKPVFQMT